MVSLPSTDHSIWFNSVVFVAAAVGVWLSGAKLSSYVDILADRTGIGKAFAGALLLGGATSLPEIATTLTAATRGASTMAGTNLLGGVAMQIAVLAIMDRLVLKDKPLTFFSPNAILLMQGVTLIGLLAMAVLAIASGELFSWAGIGLWPIILTACYLIALYVGYRYEDSSRWEPAGEIAQPPESAKDMKDAQSERFRDVSKTNLCMRFLGSAVGVLVFGFLVATAGEVLAEQTGLGQGLVGAIFVALATSMPELSTTWSAVRFGAYSMAVANILGTNSLEVALLLPADVAFRGGSIIDSLDSSASFLAGLGIVITTVYLWGILERRDRTIFGMGIDSAIVLLIYVCGMALYTQIG